MVPHTIPAYFAFATLIGMISMVAARAWMMSKKGIRAFVFGRTDKRDFFIPPVFLFFAYQLAAYSFGFPKLGERINLFFFHSETLGWLGVVSCLAGLLGLFWSLISFGRSFRVGVDDQAPDKLVTDGIFAYTRNPIYLAFWFILMGFFLIFPSPVFIVLLLGGTLLFNRQVLVEEKFLQKHYGEEFTRYRQKVRRYL